MPGSSRRFLAGLLLVSSMGLGTALAQEAQTQQALARAQSLLRQVSAQKQELEVANARLTAEIAALESKLNRSEAGLKEASISLQSEQRKAERAGGALESTSEQLVRTQVALQDSTERLRLAKADLREKERVMGELQSRVTQVEEQLADTERKNIELYRLNVELMDLYRAKGPLTALLQKEPMTGLRSVAIENTLQEYRLKLEDQLAQDNREIARDEPVSK